VHVAARPLAADQTYAATLAIVEAEMAAEEA
jgi:hypothetical protein